MKGVLKMKAYKMYSKVDGKEIKVEVSGIKYEAPVCKVYIENIRKGTGFHDKIDKEAILAYSSTNGDIYLEWDNKRLVITKCKEIIKDIHQATNGNHLKGYL